MELFMVGFALSASLCFDIGVANVAVIQTSLTRGTAPGIYMGLGATTSDFILCNFITSRFIPFIK